MPCLARSFAQSESSYLRPQQAIDHTRTNRDRALGYLHPRRSTANYRSARESYCILSQDKKTFLMRVIGTPENLLTDQFHTLALQWREEIGPDSSLSNIVSNINYLRVISLGPSVVPLILRDLQRQPAPWFVALRAITGNDTIGAEYPGNFKKKAEAWLQWGRDHGLVDAETIS
jgi:hypothetical protein